MINIPLQAIPNQNFNIQLNEQSYDITIKSCANSTNPLANFMVATIFINNVLIIENVRLTGYRPIIPYKYLENGNFLIITMNGEYPDYMLFNNTQFLIYVSQAELDAIRNASP
jgi:hypothetical protein